jgi:hypothetical protein
MTGLRTQKRVYPKARIPKSAYTQKRLYRKAHIPKSHTIFGPRFRAIQLEGVHLSKNIFLKNSINSDNFLKNFEKFR